MNERIEKSTYQGYVWKSDIKAPKIDIYDNEEVELELDETKNPFIVEGFLVDDNYSYSIKYVDGKYYVNKYDLNSLKDVDKTSHEYLSSFDSTRRLLFNQYWRPYEDELCDGGMDVLQPAEYVFVGFKKEEE
nr:TIGR04423 family type III CRISPR-associated protein [uncultured Bacteroides sp.]